uniref:Uncharacterized protein n=1 Tax=Panagrolaimus sp. ES5 TaxID=591445 RepID=A0AC34F0Z8_9BILA
MKFLHIILAAFVVLLSFSAINAADVIGPCWEVPSVLILFKIVIIQNGQNSLDQVVVKHVVNVQHKLQHLTSTTTTFDINEIILPEFRPLPEKYMFFCPLSIPNNNFFW